MREFVAALGGAPDWVLVWESARAAGDERLLPELIPAIAEAGLEIPAQPLTDAQVWIQPGEYGYQGCAYDFAAELGQNRVCVWHPSTATRQPLRRELIGGMAFVCCLDCAERAQRHAREEPELQAQTRRAREWLASRLRKRARRKVRPRVAEPDEDDLAF